MQKFSEKRFYVYGLAYPNGDLFYVGKGSGQRVFDHEKMAHSLTDAKSLIIQGILSSGQEVKKEFLYETDNEVEAYEVESEYIKDFSGLVNVKSTTIGRLCTDRDLDRISASIDEDLKNALIKQAKKEHRSVSSLVSVGLEMYLKSVKS